jgi:hypothetical protein
MESANSANWGSSALTAGSVEPTLFTLPRYPCDSRNDDRELGRNGVVGRDEGRGRDADLGTLWSISTRKSFGK